jgi:hypothetical protein
MKTSPRSLFSLEPLVLSVSAGVQWWHGLRDAQCAERLRTLQAPGTPVILVPGKPQLGFDPERLLEALHLQG